MLYNYHAIMGRFISGKKQLIQLLSDGLALGKDFSFRIKRTINTPDNIDDIVVETFNESVKYNGTNGKQYYLSANKSQLESVLTVHTPAALAKMITFITVTASEIGSKSSSVGLGVGNSSTDAIQTKQDDFNDALAAMAPAIVSNDSDDDEWD